MRKTIIIIIILLLYSCNEKTIEPIIEEPNNPTLKLLTPNGNEIFATSELINISWESSNIFELDIEISYDEGNSWHLVAERLDSLNKSFNYRPVDTCSYNCLIKIKDSKNSDLLDTSDSTFTIIDLNEAKKYYQLKVGNLWVYEKNNGYDFNFEKREIVGDTIIGNINYFIMWISDPPNYFKYFRVNKYGDLIEFSGNRETIILDFKSPPGKYQINEAVVVIRGDTSKTFFNKLTNVKWQYFQYGSGFGNETKDEFAMGLGKTYEHYADLWNYTDYVLKGAVIDHVLYGDTTSSN